MEWWSVILKVIRSIIFFFMCPEWHPRMKASWRQGQIFWLITSNATRASKHRTLGRGCMWHYYVAVYGHGQALHVVPKLKCGGGGRGGDTCTAPRTINQPGHHIHHRPHPKNTNQYPNLYLHSYSCLICGITCYATLVEWVYNYLNAITWQLIKSFFSNLNDLKVFIQFYWTQVWSYCVALSLTGAEESDVVIVW